MISGRTGPQTGQYHRQERTKDKIGSQATQTKARTGFQAGSLAEQDHRKIQDPRRQ
jgi:hypothetical protein